MRTATSGLLLMAAGMLLASTCWAGVPGASTSTLWADQDTLKLNDTTTVYIIVRDVYGEPLPDLECFFYSDRVGVDFFIGSPDTSDIDGFAQARLWSNQFNFWPNVPQVAHITVDCEGVVIGPINVYWLCRAGVDDGRGAALALYQNTPNPFKGSTEIAYGVERPGRVSLDVYNVLGKKVRSLLGSTVGAGRHRIVWDGNDDAGRPLPSGTYYIRMAAPGFDETRSLVLLR